MVTVKQALRKCDVLSGFGDGELEKLASLALEKRYDAGTTIFREGDRAEELLILQEGKVALQMQLPSVQGQISRRITVDIVNQNEVVGWSVIVEPHIYTLTAICLQKVMALALNGGSLRRMLEENYKIGYEVTKGLSKVVARRLDDTRRVLVSERLFSMKPE